ncbi:MAG: DNA replication/repair protein RecF [Ruminococcaceae bacterium]|nr:DNA replication/repair protein RecF [Oscillospiraceae bacterium]
MICKKIKIQNFRNIEECEVEFSPRVNLLYGDNAQGKTNLLEAIYYTALGKSFRPAKEAELIRYDSEGALVENIFEDSIREQKLSVQMFGGRAKRIVKHNGVKVDKLSEMMGVFRVVLFCPEHLSLIQGGPDLRRSYMNVALSQLRPAYLRSLQRYNHILKERNALLKTAFDQRAVFEATEPMWSEQLAQEAAYLTIQRYRYIKAVNQQIKLSFKAMMGKYEGGDEIPQLTYAPTLGNDWLTREGLWDDMDKLTEDMAVERYRHLLSAHHDREIATGGTMYGIHRDDIKITLNGRPARLYASQGQQRSLALAMKLAEGWVSAKEFGGEMPVFLFDDVLSELDVHRREYLVSEMTDRQVIMTACDPDAADFGMSGVRHIHVHQGVYHETEV